MAGDLVGQGPGEAGDCGPYAVRENQAVHRLLHGDGRDIQDPTESPVLHSGHHLPAETDHAVEVLADGGAPGLCRVGLEWTRRRASRIRHEYVHRAEGFLCCTDQPRDLLGVTEIHGQRTYLCTRCAKLFCGSLEIGLAPSANHQAAALGRQSICNSPAEAATRGTNEGYASCETQIHGHCSRK